MRPVPQLPSSSVLDHLSSRESEVLALVACGLTSAQIALRFGRSIRTVDSHRIAIRRKAGLRRILEWKAVAERQGLIVKPDFTIAPTTRRHEVLDPLVERICAKGRAAAIKATRARLAE